MGNGFYRPDYGMGGRSSASQSVSHVLCPELQILPQGRWSYHEALLDCLTPSFACLGLFQILGKAAIHAVPGP